MIEERDIHATDAALDMDNPANGPPYDSERLGRHRAEEWLLIEWPEGEVPPNHYWLATLPADISLESMVDQAKLRWRIERDYLELKQEVGRGPTKVVGGAEFTTHASRRIAAYGFLISEKEMLPPQDLPAICRCGRNAACHIPSPHCGLRLARTPVLVLPRCPCCGQSPLNAVKQNK